MILRTICILILIIYSLMVSGCAGLRKLPQEEVKKPHSLLIVPLRSAPMNIGGSPGLAALFPLISVISDGVKKKSRKEVAANLTDQLGVWNPAVVYAQECSRIISKNNLPTFNNVTVVKDLELPDATELRKKEPNLFHVKVYMTGWNEIGDKWAKSDDVTIHYNQQYPDVNADWALETFNSYIVFINGNTRGVMMVAMKVVDINSNEVVASITPTQTAFDIRGLVDASTFKEDFRAGSNKSCSLILGKLGVIPLQQ